jgi:uncharacterized protein with PIN domain
MDLRAVCNEALIMLTPKCCWLLPSAGEMLGNLSLLDARRKVPTSTQICKSLIRPPSTLLLANVSATIGLKRLPVWDENAMISVHVRCYAELNDGLPEWAYQRMFSYKMREGGSVAELTKALGLPDESVDLILVNGESVSWSHVLNDGDWVSLYPVFESFDISTITRLRAEPLRQPRFVLDVHLGKLAHHLRMLGFDTAYSTRARDADLVALAIQEARTLLSKDRELIEKENLPRRYRVRATDSRLQLIEVLRRFDLFNSFHPFTRCIKCNTLLTPIAREDILHRLPPKVRETYTEFQACPQCDQVYWKGSHYRRMWEFIEEIKKVGGESRSPRDDRG